MFNAMFFRSNSSNVSVDWFPHYPPHQSHASNNDSAYIALITLAGFMGLAVLCACCYRLRNASVQSVAHNSATPLIGTGAPEVVVQSDSVRLEP